MASEKNKDVKTTEYENKFSFPHYWIRCRYKTTCLSMTVSR
jgi:hypothetical protein